MSRTGKSLERQKVLIDERLPKTKGSREGWRAAAGD